MSKRWIKCGVLSGMFTDERLIEMNEQTFFVHQRSVRNVSGDRGEVEVTVVERDGQKWAVLPTSTRDMVPLRSES